MHATHNDYMETIRDCSTCGHQNMRGSSGAPGLAYCELTGSFCGVQRRYPSPPCDINLSGWTPKPPSLWDRFKTLLGHLRWPG